MARLGDICTFQSGGTPSKTVPAYYQGNIPWITTVSLTGGRISNEAAIEYITDQAIRESAAKIVPQNSIMVGTRVGVGKVAINTVPMSTSQDIISLLNIDERTWDKDFLCKFIAAKSAYLNSQARGATIKGIKIETLASLDLPEITLEEQKHISRVIDEVLQLVKYRKDQLNELDQLVKSRFIELFGLPGSDEKGRGMIALGSVCQVNPKKGKDKRLTSGLEISFVPMLAVSESGEIDPSEVRVYDAVKTGFTYFAENDVLFAKITPCMENGKGAVAKGLHNGIGFGSTEFHVLRPVQGKTDPYWIYTLTAFPEFRSDAASNMTGSAGQRRVPASFLEQYRVSVPPIQLQEQFSTFVEQTDKLKFAVQNAVYLQITLILNLVNHPWEHWASVSDKGVKL